MIIYGTGSSKPILLSQLTLKIFLTLHNKLTPSFCTIVAGKRPTDFPAISNWGANDLQATTTNKTQTEQSFFSYQQAFIEQKWRPIQCFCAPSVPNILPKIRTYYNTLDLNMKRNNLFVIIVEKYSQDRIIYRDIL